MFITWCQHLAQAGIQYRPDIARTEYLSNPDERLRWQANALPTDDLCTENAIMLKVTIINSFLHCNLFVVFVAFQPLSFDHRSIWPSN